MGSVYEVASGRKISRGDLARALDASDVVLLGEQHDNIDHHRIQAFLLRELIAAGRRPVVAFEQIDVAQQDALDHALAAHAGQSPAALADAVADAAGWQKSGWPPFDQYRPVFETALAAGLPVRAANLPRSQMKDLFGTKTAAATGEDPSFAFSPSELASLKADIVDSHCGYAGEDLVGPMISAEKRRDRTMADVVVSAAGQSNGGVVLISGFGHARKDYAVPFYLRRLVPALKVASVGLLEVSDDALHEGDYAALLHASVLPFDFVMFTPRVSNEDPCEKFRAGLEKMKSR
ncbi:MAG TPA: ChaN family lipoprotein [Candidatus Binatia bacterium]